MNRKHSKRRWFYNTDDETIALNIETNGIVPIACGHFGVKRQIFFVSLKGFDAHSDVLRRHDEQMSLFDDALASFHET